MTERPDVVVAVDPGRSKCGVAAVSADGEVLSLATAAADQVGLTAAALAHTYNASTIVLGASTGAPRAWELIHAADPALSIVEIEEDMSTLEARDRYWQENPPGCLTRFIPAGLRTPPEPIDDWAAVVLAERFLAKRSPDVGQGKSEE
jgi:RNase H-fold protein (predicted Holliday junction resolvase)